MSIELYEPKIQYHRMTSKSLAASTSSVLVNAGTKSACRYTQKQRAAYAMSLVVIKNSLADGKNMLFVETVLERETTMPRGAKRDALPGRRSVGHVARVSFDESVAH